MTDPLDQARQAADELSTLGSTTPEYARAVALRHDVETWSLLSIAESLSRLAYIFTDQDIDHVRRLINDQARQT